MLIKSRIPEIFLGALLATALIAMGAVFGSSQVSTPAARNSGSDKGGNESTKAGQSKSEWMTSENLLALFTLGLVIVGGVQLWLFFVQLRLIRESLDDAKLTAEAAKEAAETSKLHADIAQGTLKTMQDTAERQLRAYVLIPSAHVKNIAEGNGPPVAHVQIKNFGQTPAYKVVNIGGFAID